MARFIRNRFNEVKILLALTASARRFNLIDFTRKLVDIDSTTFCEGQVGDYLAEYLKARSWVVEKTVVPQPPDPKYTGPRWNVYAGVIGEVPDVVFSTHLDTVPPYIGFTEDSDFIYGRGVCDAKGIIASQVAAAEELRAQGFRVGLLFVSGEENGSEGARVANTMPKGSRFLVNGEPTGNELAVACKGTLRVMLRSRGEVDDLEDCSECAVCKMIDALTNLLSIALPIDEQLGPCTLNIGRIYGGQDIATLAKCAEADILLRTVENSGVTRKAIIKAVANLVDINFIRELPCLRLKTVANVPTMVANFATDIPLLSNWGEPLLLGPGSIQDAHTPTERLSKRELVEGVDQYVNVAKKILGFS